MNERIRIKSAADRVFLLIAIWSLFSSCLDTGKENFVFVKGGIFANKKSNLYGKNVRIPDFYLGKYEVTQKEWTEIMGNNPSKFKGDDLPVEMVSWYDCIEFCNKKSIRDGLDPYYHIDKMTADTANRNKIDSVKWSIAINNGANGYRLPTEAEWEYAASGGQKTGSYVYSGSNDVDQVAWYWRNSGDNPLTASWNWSAIEENNNKPQPVGMKKPNELGVFDMSGNVREWCEDWYVDANTGAGYVRVQRGGGWIGGKYRCQFNVRHYFEASGKGPDQGFRLCRSSTIGQ